MKVYELVEILAKCPQNADVWVYSNNEDIFGGDADPFVEIIGAGQVVEIKSWTGKWDPGAPGVRIPSKKYGLLRGQTNPADWVPEATSPERDTP